MAKVKVRPRLHLTPFGAVLVMQEEGAKRHLDIRVDIFDYKMLIMALSGEDTQFTTPYDLIKAMIATLGLKVEKTVVDRMESNRCYAKICFTKGNEEISVGARPSEAVIIALRMDCPIFVEESVIEEFVRQEKGSRSTSEFDAERAWLASLDPGALTKH